MGQGIDTRQQTYCLSCFFSFGFTVRQAKRWKDKWIECKNVWTCMKDVCEYFASNTLLSEYVLMT